MKSEPDWTYFFDRLVHDLREPLRSIQSFSELLREVAGENLGTDGEMATGEILAGAAKMRTLIEALARYSWTLNPARESRELKEKGASLQLALDMKALEFDRHMVACGATIEAQNLPRVGADLEPLSHLFHELIANSLQFRADAPPVIRISAQPDPAHDNQWLIRVQDNGIGIPPAELETVFQPFTRLHGRKYPGAGLGLPACRNIVEAYGGTIWMEPSPDGGCICAFTLPRADA